MNIKSLALAIASLGASSRNSASTLFLDSGVLPPRRIPFDKVPVGRSFGRYFVQGRPANVPTLTKDHAFYIARAQLRRDHRAAKRAENARRTEEGKLRAKLTPAA